MFVTALPAALDSTAASLMGLGSSVTAGNAAAAAPTTGVIPPAAHPAAILSTAQFGVHGGHYQVTSAVSAAIHEMFVAMMGASAASYAATEAAAAIDL